MSEIYGEREEGEGIIIVGMGRRGKSGKGVLTLRADPRPIKFIIAPRMTNKTLMKDLDRNQNGDGEYYQIQDADHLSEIYNKAQEEKSPSDIFLIVVPKRPKGCTFPTIFKILQDKRFHGAAFMIDEVKVLTDDAESFDDLDNLIRLVGQYDQFCILISHKIRRDMSTAAPLNVQQIWYVGSLADKGELKAIWEVSDLAGEMDFVQFEEIMRSQVKKYDWWNKKPNEKAVIKIYG
jgi:hypothetical protein